MMGIRLLRVCRRDHLQLLCKVLAAGAQLTVMGSISAPPAGDKLLQSPHSSDKQGSCC